MSNEETKVETYSGEDPTPPTGQGGATPKTRPDHQDMFPPNPPQSEAGAAYAAKIDELGSNVAAASAPEDDD